MCETGREPLVAPRVLVDATAVPADRGGVGRYVDGLLGALDEESADIEASTEVDASASALALLQDGLGAQVIGEIDQS